MEGIRHAEAAAALRQSTAPLPFFRFYLDLPAPDGLVRACARDGQSSHPDASHPVEQDLPAVRALASLVVPVSGRGPPRSVDRSSVTCGNSSQENAVREAPGESRRLMPAAPGERIAPASDLGYVEDFPWTSARCSESGDWLSRLDVCLLR